MSQPVLRPNQTRGALLTLAILALVFTLFTIHKRFPHLLRSNADDPRLDHGPVPPQAGVVSIVDGMGGNSCTVRARVTDPDSAFIVIRYGDDKTLRVQPGETFEMPAGRGHFAFTAIDDTGLRHDVGLLID